MKVKNAQKFNITCRLTDDKKRVRSNIRNEDTAINQFDLPTMIVASFSAVQMMRPKLFVPNGVPDAPMLPFHRQTKPVA